MGLAENESALTCQTQEKIILRKDIEKLFPID